MTVQTEQLLRGVLRERLAGEDRLAVGAALVQERVLARVDGGAVVPCDLREEHRVAVEDVEVGVAVGKERGPDEPGLERGDQPERASRLELHRRHAPHSHQSQAPCQRCPINRTDHMHLPCLQRFSEFICK